MNTTDLEADVLDIKTKIVDRTFINTLFDKRREFPFLCNVLPAHDTNLSAQCLRNVIINELTRIFSICSNLESFADNSKRLENKLLEKGYHSDFVRHCKKSFANNNFPRILDKYKVSQNKFLEEFQL